MVRTSKGLSASNYRFFWTQGRGKELLKQRNSDELSEVKITVWKSTVCPAHSDFAGWIFFSNLALSPKIFSVFGRYNKHVPGPFRSWRKCISSVVCLCTTSLPKASWCGSVWDPGPSSACWFLPGCPFHHSEHSLASDQAQPLLRLHMDHPFTTIIISPPFP